MVVQRNQVKHMEDKKSYSGAVTPGTSIVMLFYAGRLTGKCLFLLDILSQVLLRLWFETSFMSFFYCENLKLECCIQIPRYCTS